MLKNAYLLAKIGADTAENERKFAEFAARAAGSARRPAAGTRRRPASPGERWVHARVSQGFASLGKLTRLLGFGDLI